MMKISKLHCVLFFILLVTLLVTIKTCDSIISDNETGDIIFSDDFNGDSLNTKWKLIENGCIIDVLEGNLVIKGKSLFSGWEKSGNGIYTEHEFPNFDFNIYVDFMVPQFGQNGVRLVYLQVNGDSSTTVGLFYQVDFGYRVQTWDPPQVSSKISSFGDESTSFHRMKLVYSSNKKVLKGYVDDLYVGSLNIDIRGNLNFSILGATDSPNNNIEIKFDNFTAIKRSD